MATTEAQTSSTGTDDGLIRLAERVLNEDTHGTSYFFPGTASGTPLGLIGFVFGLTLLSLAQTNLLDTATIGIVIPVAFGLSGLLTLVGGLWDFRAGNLFGGVWQVLYAGFWFSVGLTLNTYGAEITAAAGALKFSEAFGTYLLVLAVVTLAALAASYFIALEAFAAFLLLVVLEVLIGLGYIYSNVDLRKIGGYVGLADAAVSLYLGAALLINTTAGRTVLSVRLYPYKRSASVQV